MITIETLCDNVNESLEGKIEEVEEPEVDEEEDRPEVEDLIIRFSCKPWKGGKGVRFFRITCRDYREHNIAEIPCPRIALVDDHPSLWDYNEEQAYLRFTSKPENPYEVIGRIWETYQEVTRGWEGCGTCLNFTMGPGIHRALEMDSGLLAMGPWPLLEAYRRAIGDRMELQMTLATDFTSAPEFRRYKALLFGEDAVVCREVEVVEETRTP
jgi:hypothetical protein